MSDVALGTSFLIFSLLINLPKEYIQLIFFWKKFIYIYTHTYTHTHMHVIKEKKEFERKRE